MFCVILFYYAHNVVLNFEHLTTSWIDVVYHVTIRVWLRSQINNAPVCKISGGPWNIDPMPWPAKLGHTVNPSFLAMNLNTNKGKKANRGILIYKL